MTTVQQVLDRLIEKEYKISFAESCTGGLATARLVEEPNASRVLDAAVVTYANEAKVEYLGVCPETIAAHGVVSEAVVEQMAKGIAERNGAEVGVGISGIAGPSGGSVDKPVGTVCFGFYVNRELYTYTEHFGNIGRNQVREKSVEFVYETLLKLL